MRHLSTRLWTPLILALVGGVALTAQTTTGSLSGAITTAQKRPLAGARVILSSPALFQPRVHVTDAKGEFRDPMLPVGYYTITITKDGFVGRKAAELRIGLGANLRQDFTLVESSVAEATVEVVDSSARASKADTKESYNYSAELLNALPVSRSFSGVTDLTPGTSGGGPGGVRVRGGDSIRTQYRINGADFSNPLYDYSRGNSADSYVIEDNIEDIQVVLSPLHAKDGRSSSGQINVATKSGGNAFSGSFRINPSRPSWVANGHASQRSAYQGTGATDDLSRTYHLTLNGPILKDRLWFSVGFIRQPDSTSRFRMGTFNQRPEDGGYNSYALTGNPLIDTQIHAGAGQLKSQGYAPWFGERTPENTKLYSNVSKTLHNEGKFTWGISQDHILEYSIFSNESSQSVDNAGPYARESQFGPYKFSDILQALAYRATLSSKTFLEVKWSRKDETRRHNVGDTTFNEEVLLHSADAQGYHYNYDKANHWGGMAKIANTGWVSDPERTMNRSLSANLKTFWTTWGEHESDLGVEYFVDRYKSAWGYGDNNRKFFVGGALGRTPTDNPGQLKYLAVNWDPNFDYNYQGGYFDPVDGYEHQWWYQNGSSYGPSPYVIEFLGKDSITSSATTSIYLNDAWTVNKHWNVMLGLRYDRYVLQGQDGVQVGNANRISPRFSVKFDPSGDSARVFSLSFGRFSDAFPQNFVRRFLTLSDQKLLMWGWNANADYTEKNPSKPLASWVDWSAITNMANYGRLVGALDQSKENKVDPDIRTPYADEISVGYLRNFSKGHVSLKSAFRQFKNMFGFEQQWDPHWLVAEGDPRPVPDPKLPVSNKLIYYASNNAKLKRNFYDLELEWTHTLSSRWTWGGSFEWKEEIGNDRSSDTTSVRNVSPSLNFSEILTRPKEYGGMGYTMDQVNPMGPLASKLDGTAWISCTLPVGKGRVSLSPMLTWGSTSPYGIYTDAPMTLPNLPLPDPNGKAPSKPDRFGKYVSGLRDFDIGNTDNYSTRIKIALDLPLGIHKLRLFGELTVYNLFNHHYQYSSYMPTSWAQYPEGRYLITPSKASYAGTTSIPDDKGNVTSGYYFTSSRSASFSLGLRF